MSATSLCVSVWMPKLHIFESCKLAIITAVPVLCSHFTVTLHYWSLSSDLEIIPQYLMTVSLGISHDYIIDHFP